MDVTDRDGSTVHVGFRLDADLKDRVDRMVERMSAHLGGANISRSTVLQMCVANYLKRMEEMYP